MGSNKRTKGSKMGWRKLIKILQIKKMGHNTFINIGIEENSNFLFEINCKNL